MNKTIVFLFAAILAVSAPLSAGAEEWNTMGPRAMGMGGAGVALAQGPLASYWNPAALGRATENAYGFTLPVGVHAALTGTVIEGLNDLQNLKNACQGAGAATCNNNGEINTALAEFGQPGNGLRVDGDAGGDFKVGKVAFFVNGFLDAGAIPRVDNSAADTNSVALAAGQNNSKLIVKGVRLLEFGAGYGHELPFAPGVFIGGNFKVMRAQVGYADYFFLRNNGDNGNNSNIVGTMRDGAVNSANIGLDAAALWDVNKSFDGAWWAPRVGLTGRNLNNPKFSQPAAAAADGVNGRYAVNPQARLGLALSPLHFWNIAADLDLTRNLTPVDGVASRQFSLGTEVNVFNRSWINIPLRFGVERNLETATNMLTAGTGLNFLHLIIDVAGEVSPKTVQSQSFGGSKKVPQELGASVSLSLLFGGSEDERSSPKPAADVQPVPAQKAMAPSNTSGDLPRDQADRVKKNAAQSQKELDQTKPAPSGN